MGSLILGGLFLAVCIIAAISIKDLAYFTEYGFGPGFFPFWCIIGIGFCSVVIVLQNRIALKTKVDRVDLRAKLKGLAGPVGSLFFAGIAMEILGLLLVSFLMVAFLMFQTGKHSLKSAIVVSVTFTVAVYIVFVRLLGINLGVGILGF
jgi:hypothetical protein